MLSEKLFIVVIKSFLSIVLFLEGNSFNIKDEILKIIFVLFEFLGCLLLVGFIIFCKFFLLEV